MTLPRRFHSVSAFFFSDKTNSFLKDHFWLNKSGKWRRIRSNVIFRLPPSVFLSHRVHLKSSVIFLLPFSLKKKKKKASDIFSSRMKNVALCESLRTLDKTSVEFRLRTNVVSQNVALMWTQANGGNISLLIYLIFPRSEKKVISDDLYYYYRCRQAVNLKNNEIL